MPKSGERAGKKVKKFTGPLAEPIVVKVYHRTLVGLTAEEAKKRNAEEWARVVKLLSDKFELLFQYFSIPKTGNVAEDYRALSWALATECFPGFQLVPAGAARPGRAAHETMFLMGLLVDVEQKKGRCGRLARRFPTQRRWPH